MNTAEIELRMLGIVKETIGSESKRVLGYAETLAAVAAATRLSGGTPGVPGPDPAELRCAMLERCAENVGKNRELMGRYARAAQAMAVYERIVAGDQFEVKPDGSISVLVKAKGRDTQ